MESAPALSPLQSPLLFMTLLHLPFAVSLTRAALLLLQCYDDVRVAVPTCCSNYSTHQLFVVLLTTLHVLPLLLILLA